MHSHRFLIITGLLAFSLTAASCQSAATPTAVSTSTALPAATVTNPPPTVAPTPLLATSRPPTAAPTQPPAGVNFQETPFQIEGQSITLVQGVSELEAAPGSAAKIVTRYFGNDAAGDLNGDGQKDVAFLVTQNSGGSGTFFYIVVALKTAAGYQDTNAVLLGDRIAPQTTAIQNGQVIVNYADRKPNESFAVAPSVGVSGYFAVTNGTLTKVTAP